MGIDVKIGLGEERRKKTLPASRRRWLQTGGVGRTQNPAFQVSSTDSLKPGQVPPRSQFCMGSTNSSRATPLHRLLRLPCPEEKEDKTKTLARPRKPAPWGMYLLRKRKSLFWEVSQGEH